MATGFLHPGAMGASLAAACRGVRLWCSDGRSDASRARALAAGLEDLGSLEALVHRCDVVISVCPPAEAVSVADAPVQVTGALAGSPSDWTIAWVRRSRLGGAGGPKLR